MLLDSYYYKRYLQHEMDNTLKKIRQNIDKPMEVFDAEDLFYIEKFIFESSLLFRKLMDDNKLTSDFNSMDVPTLKYELKKDYEVNQFDRWIEEDKYNFFKETKWNISPRNLSNYLIHSYVFQLDFIIDEKSKFQGIRGFYVASDKIKDKYVLHINFQTFLNVIKAVTENKITTSRYERNEQKENGNMSTESESY